MLFLFFSLFSLSFSFRSFRIALIIITVDVASLYYTVYLMFRFTIVFFSFGVAAIALCWCRTYFMCSVCAVVKIKLESPIWSLFSLVHCTKKMHSFYWHVICVCKSIETIDEGPIQYTSKLIESLHSRRCAHTHKRTPTRGRSNDWHEFICWQQRRYGCWCSFVFLAALICTFHSLLEQIQLSSQTLAG